MVSAIWLLHPQRELGWKFLWGCWKIERATENPTLTSCPMLSRKFWRLIVFSHPINSQKNRTKKSSRKEIFSGCSPQKLDLKPSRRIVWVRMKKPKKKKSVIYFPLPSPRFLRNQIKQRKTTFSILTINVPPETSTNKWILS